MNKNKLFFLFVLMGCAILFCKPTFAQQFKVLLITETAGWHHESISNGIAALNELAAQHNFIVSRQQNAQEITEERLNGFDATIFLNTSLDIFNEKEQVAFKRFIQSGKGYVGVHSASDTEYE